MTNISVTVHDHHRHNQQEIDPDLGTTTNEKDPDREMMTKPINLVAGDDAGVQERDLDLVTMMMTSTTQLRRTKMMGMFLNRESLALVREPLNLKERDPYLETMTNGYKTR